MEKTFTIVGVSTYGANKPLTKFRVANGDAEARKKVLVRAGHYDIDLVVLDTPMTKVDAINWYKSCHPDVANVRMPNQKEDKPVKAKTVVLSKSAGRKVTDAANELLKAVEEA
jgi:hypothetical protein